VQDTLPPGSIAAFHRNHPEFASVAVPQKPGEGVDLGTMFPPDPTRPPTVDEHVTIPRGYLEYLEAFVNEHLQAAADAEAGGAVDVGAVVDTDGATQVVSAAAATAAAPADNGGSADATAAAAAATPAAATAASAPVANGAVNGIGEDSMMVDAPVAAEAGGGHGLAQQPAQHVQ